MPWLLPAYCVINSLTQQSEFPASGLTSVLQTAVAQSFSSDQNKAVSITQPIATLWAAGPCNSCAEMRSCPTCDGASATRRSQIASATAASPFCPPPQLPSCCQPGPWSTSCPSPAPSRLWFSSPKPRLSPSPRRQGCEQGLGPARRPTRSALSHLPEAWRSGACQAGRAPARPTRGGCLGTWCCRMASARCPGSGRRERPSARNVSSPSPPRRSVSRSSCSAAAGRGVAGRGAGPLLRWTSSPGRRHCWPGRIWEFSCFIILFVHLFRICIHAV